MRASSLITITAALGLLPVCVADARPVDDASGPAGIRLLENDDDGDGRLGDQQRRQLRESRRARVLERFDTDGDGVLNDEEKQAIPRRHLHRGHRGRHREALLERFDTDGDGRLDEDERAAARETRRRAILERFDANGDGVIDDDEREAARNAWKERRGTPRGTFRHRRGPRGPQSLPAADV